MEEENLVIRLSVDMASMVWKKKLLLLWAIMAVLILSISMTVMGSSSSSSSSIGAIRTSEVGRHPAESLDIGSEKENMELMYLQRTSPSATTTTESLHRNDFPNGFVFGTSSSSYQAAIYPHSSQHIYIYI